MDIDKLYIFTDGSCINNGKKKNVIGGIGIYFDNHQDIFKNYNNVINDDGYKITNQTMELLACIKALQIVKDIMDNNNIKINIIYIYTDSLYVINCMVKWIDIWKKNDWKTSKGKDVENRELIELLYILKNSMNITIFKHIKAHNKEPIDKNSIEYKLWYGNYMADNLAKTASTSI